jgi:hypothetical protein
MHFSLFGPGNWGANHMAALSKMGHSFTEYSLHSVLSPNSLKSTDAAIIATSSVNHFPILHYLFRNFPGLPIYCEKPICLNKEQLEILDNSYPGSVFQGGFQLLFHDDLKPLTGKQLISASFFRSGAIPRTEGAVLSLAVHDISILAYLLSFTSFVPEDSLKLAMADGNHHSALLTFRVPVSPRNGKSTANPGIADIYVSSISPIRLRHTAITVSDFDFCSTESFFFSPDNWNQPHLLQRALEHFILCINSNEKTRASFDFSKCVMASAIEANQIIATNTGRDVNV